jgi:hypothetical protein
MHGRGDGPKRLEHRRLIAALAIRLGWTMEQVRDLEALDLDVLLQELSGKRKMTDDEIGKELARWQNATSQSSSVPIRQSSRRHSAG